MPFHLTSKKSTRSSSSAPPAAANPPSLESSPGWNSPIPATSTSIASRWPSAIDPEMTAEVLDMINELRDEGRDFILVTHEMGFARQVADQVALLADGRITEVGEVGRMFEHPASPQGRDFLARVLKY